MKEKHFMLNTTVNYQNKIKPTLFDGTTASLSESDTDDESVISFICGRDLLPYFLEPTTNFGDTSLAGELSPLFIVSLRSSVIVDDSCCSENYVHIFLTKDHLNVFIIVCESTVAKKWIYKWLSWTYV